MMLLALITRYKLLLEIVAVGALAARLAYGAHKFFDSLREEGALKERAVWVERDRKAGEEAVKREATLQAQMNKSNQEKSNALSRLASANAALAASLLHRPDRPSTEGNQPAGTGEAASGCTGAQLYRSDSAFLVGESGVADKLRIELKACYAAYDNARETLKGLK